MLRKIIDKNTNEGNNLLPNVIFIISFYITSIFHNITITISLIINAILLIFLYKKQIKRIGLFKPLMFVGNISFIVYLIHQNIGFQILLWLYNLNNMFNFAFIIITAIIVFIVAVIINNLFEKKIQTYINKKMHKGEI